MTPRCIVSDLDRTLTGKDLLLDDAARERIAQLRGAGIRVVIATGRRLDELEAMGIPALVDGIVAENGPVLCVPEERVMQVLHTGFAEQAKEALGPLTAHFEWGRVMGSGPRELALEAAGRLLDAGVAHEMEYNAEHVMVLPAGVNKATGATMCLERLGLRADQAWAIGDGENDVAMLRWARLGAAPANAAPAARDAADVLLLSAYAEGFVELTEPLVTAAPAPGT